MAYNYSEIEASKLEFVTIGDIKEIPNGERIFVEIDELNIVVFNLAGKLYAIADLCSHDDGPLGDGELESDHEIICPRHGARFDIRDGKAKTLPANIDIPAYPIRISDGLVEIGIPKEGV